MKKNLALLVILIALTAVAGVVWWLQGDASKTAGIVLNDFSISDTSQVDRIVITDTRGNTADLTRKQGEYLWTINSKYKARKDASDLLLKTFKRISVKAHVPKTGIDNATRMIAGDGYRVDIYTNGAIEKSYLIGTCTQDHFGTYMVLEHGDGTRSSEPLIMHMDGFTGCLRQRFFTSEEEWRFTGIFNYEDLDIAKIDVQNHGNPLSSFSIKYGGGNDIDLYPYNSPDKFPYFDTLAVKDYMLLYKKVHLETYDNHMTSEAEDSLKQTTPAYTIRVTENSGSSKEISLYWKASIMRQLDMNGQVMEWDGDRMYGRIGDEVVMVQRYTFDPLMRDIRGFLY